MLVTQYFQSSFLLQVGRHVEVRVALPPLVVGWVM